MVYSANAFLIPLQTPFLRSDVQAPPARGTYAVRRAQGLHLPFASVDLAQATVPSNSLAICLAVCGAVFLAASQRLARRRRGFGARPNRRSTKTYLLAGASVQKAAKHANDTDVLDLVVIGGGVSGLSAALEMQRLSPSAKIVVAEASDRVGGNVLTRMRDGRIWEEGPNSFQPEDSILKTACDIGLKDDILLADPASYRYVWWEGQLRPLPLGPIDAVLGDFLSPLGKLSAALGAVGLKEPMPDREESLKDFVVRNLGEEAFERLVDPFVSGVYAGDASCLSAEASFGKVHMLEKNGGSLLGGVIQAIQERVFGDIAETRDPRLPEVAGQTVASFRGGMQQFTDTLSNHIVKKGASVRLSWKVKELRFDPASQQHTLVYDTPEGLRKTRSRSVVITSPAHVAANILKETSPIAARVLQEIRYPQVAAVTAEYPRRAFREPEHGKGVANGFGQLHPRSQGLRTLGTIYSSSLFPDRQPDPDKVTLLHFIGGARDPELFGGIGTLSENELVEVAHQDSITTMLLPGASKMYPEVLGVKVWPRAIPQMELGHSKRLEEARRSISEAGLKGLFLAGNYVGGVSMSRCVEFGIETGREASSFVAARFSTA